MTLSVEKVLAQIEKLNGNVAAVARRLRVSRKTVYLFIKEHPELRDALEDARETMLDEAEDSLGKAIRRGDAWAVCFSLKTQGKERGYVERIENTGRDGKDLNQHLTVEIVKTNKDEAQN